MSAVAVKPNVGAAVSDTVAAGENFETQNEWLAQHGVQRQERIILKKLTHVRYQHPNLDEISTFLQDFGMQIAKKTTDEIWFKGYGPDQYVYYARRGPKRFLGGTFEVESKDDFERALALPGAGSVEDMVDAPGGGQMVTILDPEGFPINLSFGQELLESRKVPEKLPLNYEVDKERIRKFQRFQPGPAGVHKLGHFGYSSTKFHELLHFYTSNFNIVPSDCVYVMKEGEQEVVTIFAHLDLGDTLVDHHSFFLSAGATSHVHHCSFEVHDYDTQNLGHQWLAQKGYQSVWGVGRHVLGSQIFDYWWDTTGNMVEHYADGDLVNCDTPIAYVEAGSESLAIWGPELPPTFLQ